MESSGIKSTQAIHGEIFDDESCVLYCALTIKEITVYYAIMQERKKRMKGESCGRDY